ncbi:MAG: LPS-assembly protein LptD [Roseibacillus sp.]
MRIGQRLLILLLLGSSYLPAQTNTKPPSQTTPTLAPVENSPSLTDGLITPTGFMPDGFTSTLNQPTLTTSEETGNMVVSSKGGVKVRTDVGDTIRSKRIRVEFGEESGSNVTFFNDVELRSTNGIEIFADKAQINEATESITFSGNVSAYQGTALHRGESATYYYKSRRMETNNLRTSFAPILLESGKFKVIESDKGNYYKGTNAGVTTHDVANPNYWLRAEEITIIPDDRVRFRNLKLYAGGRPILWLPGLSQKFDGELNYRPTPGMRSNWGPYLLNQYTHDYGGILDPQTGIRTEPTHELTWHGDIYTRRGLGLGLDADSYSQKENPNLGWISGYFIYDFDPSEKRSAEPRLNFDQNERFRLQARQRAKADWLPGAEGHVDINATLLSDRYFLEDFRTQDFTTDFHPDNTLSLTQSWRENHLLTAWTRFRLNDFYQSDQRFPEIAFDQIRRPLFGSPILHESNSTIGLYREELADFTEENLRDEFDSPTTTADRRRTIQGLLADTGFARFHTYQELSLPLKLDSGLHLIPRIGAGHTSYQDVQGPLDSFSRNHFHASIDASLKFTKRYPEWVSEKWGLNSALHVLQPYATATILKTDDLDAMLRPIERLTASTRPRALQPGRFAATDDLTDWQILRLGVRNQLLTKRDNSSHQWLSLDTYIDIFGEDPEFGRSVSNLYTDLHWSPLPWLDLTVETQVPLFSDSNFTEVATGLTFMPGANTELAISHRFLQDHPILNDSNRLQLRAYHRVNEEWGIGATQRWEFADNSLEFQQYSLHRNLDSWAFTMGVFSRDNSDEKEYGVLFGFTLTEFPSLSLPLSIDN